MHFLLLKLNKLVQLAVRCTINSVFKVKLITLHDMYICLSVKKKKEKNGRDNYFLANPIIISSTQRLNTYSKAIVQNFYRPSFVTVRLYSHFFHRSLQTGSLSYGSISRSSTCLASAFQFSISKCQCRRDRFVNHF